MNIDDIKSLIAANESRTLELKKSTGELKDGMHLPQHLKNKITTMIKSQKGSITESVDNTLVEERAGESVQPSAGNTEIKQTDVDFKNAEEIMSVVLKGETIIVEDIKRKLSRLKRNSRIS